MQFRKLYANICIIHTGGKEIDNDYRNTRKAHNDDEKCTGDIDTAYIWVEPTARVVLTPEVDTLCNESFANILVSIPTVSTNDVKYK